MLEQFEKHNKGIIGTTVFHVVIILIILFLGFRTPLPLPGEEGILITFGTDDDGLGFTQPARQQASPPASTPPPSQPTQAEEQIITQDIEEAPSLPQPRREETVRPEPVRPAEQPSPQPPEPVATEEKVEEVPERRPNPNALFPGRTASGETGTSAGETTGQGNHGRETGSADSPHRTGGDAGSPDGISFSLDGRTHFELPLPVYERGGGGVVIVEVTVNRSGVVTYARAGVQGTTNSDYYLLNAAENAAKKARFNVSTDAPESQRGTITYIFRQQ